MARLSKNDLLSASDLRTKEVELETIGGSVLVQGLSAAYSNQASSEALEMKTTARGDQIASVNTAKLETIQVLHGLVDPKLENLEEAEKFMQNCGPAAKRIVEAIDELSGLDKEALETAQAKFQGGGTVAPGTVVDDGAAPGGS